MGPYLRHTHASGGSMEASARVGQSLPLWQKPEIEAVAIAEITTLAKGLTKTEGATSKDS